MLKVRQKYSAVNFRPSPLKKLLMWHIGTILSIKNYPHGCQRGDTFVIYYICSDFWFPLLWEKGFFGICWFSSFPTATFLIFLHLPHFHGLITRANLPTIVTHNNTRQHTTTHDDAHPYNCSCWRWSQRRTPKFGLYHMLCRFCMFFLFSAGREKKKVASARDFGW